MKQKQQKMGLYTLGFVENKSTYVNDLQKLLNGTEYIASKEEINEFTLKVEYYNQKGFQRLSNGDCVNSNNATYIRFKTIYKTMNDEIIYGWFTRSKSIFKGVEWGTEKQFQKKVKRNSAFSIGCMYFDHTGEGLSFLEDIASNTIPETWKYRNNTSFINYPILKSYLENVLERLKKEEADGKKDKILYSKDKKYVMFNTNLLDIYFHEVIVVGEVEHDGEDFYIKNPHRSANPLERRTLGFGKSNPIQPQFFDDINDVIYQVNWDILKDFDKFTHIIQERIDRFPEEYKEDTPDYLARRLDDAISFAVTLAQRNYKFLVPMYRPQTHSIQLLMPIYLNKRYSERPDFALVLTPNKDAEMYVPETILPLDAVYQNARLIAKPDELWLNPNTIK